MNKAKKKKRALRQMGARRKKGLAGYLSLAEIYYPGMSTVPKHLPLQDIHCSTQGEYDKPKITRHLFGLTDGLRRASRIRPGDSRLFFSFVFYGPQAGRQTRPVAAAKDYGAAWRRAQR